MISPMGYELWRGDDSREEIDRWWWWCDGRATAAAWSTVVDGSWIKRLMSFCASCSRWFVWNDGSQFCSSTNPWLATLSYTFEVKVSHASVPHPLFHNRGSYYQSPFFPLLWKALSDSPCIISTWRRSFFLLSRTGYFQLQSLTGRRGRHGYIVAGSFYNSLYT